MENVGGELLAAAITATVAVGLFLLGNRAERKRREADVREQFAAEVVAAANIVRFAKPAQVDSNTKALSTALVRLATRVGETKPLTSHFCLAVAAKLGSDVDDRGDATDFGWIASRVGAAMLTWLAEKGRDEYFPRVDDGGFWPREYLINF